MTAKEIIIDELENGIHPEKVEDVIFWALEYYCTHRRKGTWGGDNCLCNQTADFG